MCYQIICVKRYCELHIAWFQFLPMHDVTNHFFFRQPNQTWTMKEKLRTLASKVVNETCHGKLFLKFEAWRCQFFAAMDQRISMRFALKWKLATVVTSCTQFAGNVTQGSVLGSAFFVHTQHGVTVLIPRSWVAGRNASRLQDNVMMRCLIFQVVGCCFFSRAFTNSVSSFVHATFPFLKPIGNANSPPLSIISQRCLFFSSPLFRISAVVSCLPLLSQLLYCHLSSDHLLLMLSVSGS